MIVGLEQRWRKYLLAIIAVGVAGTLVELLLLKHYDDRWQFTPLTILSALLAAIGWFVAKRSPRSIKTIRWLSLIACASAFAGVYFHFRANVEWELEVTPEMHGLELFREAITGALPLLAPGAMFQLGLLGLLWAYRHPVLTKQSSTSLMDEGSTIQRSTIDEQHA